MYKNYSTWDYKLNSGITSYAVSINEIVYLYKKKILSPSTLVKPCSCDNWLRLEDSILFSQKYISYFNKKKSAINFTQNIILYTLKPVAYLYKVMLNKSVPLPYNKSINEEYSYKEYFHKINITISRAELLSRYNNDLLVVSIIVIPIVSFLVFKLPSISVTSLFGICYATFLVIILRLLYKRSIELKRKHIDSTFNKLIQEYKQDFNRRVDLDINSKRIQRKEEQRLKRSQLEAEQRRQRELAERKQRRANFLTRTKSDMGTDSCCVYILESKDRDYLPIKLGISNNIERRVKEHRNHTNINYIPKTIIWMKNKKHAQKVESYLIKNLVRSGHPRAGNEFFAIPLETVRDNLFEVLHRLKNSRSIS